MRLTCGPPSSVGQSFTSSFTSKSLALSAATACSAAGDLIVTLGIFLGASDGVAGPNATSGSVGFSGGGGSGVGGGGGGVSAVGGGGGGGATGGGSEPPQATTPITSEIGIAAKERRPRSIMVLDSPFRVGGSFPGMPTDLKGFRSDVPRVRAHHGARSRLTSRA